MIGNNKEIIGVDRGKEALFPGHHSREIEIWRCPTKEEKELELIRGEISVTQSQPMVFKNKEFASANIPQPVEPSWSVEDAASWLSVSNYRRAIMAVQ